MGDKETIVEPYHPPAGTRVDEGGQTGMITGHNAQGNPVMLPDEAVIGHELLPGQTVTIILTPDDLA